MKAFKRAVPFLLAVGGLGVLYLAFFVERGREPSPANLVTISGRTMGTTYSVRWYVNQPTGETNMETSGLDAEWVQQQVDAVLIEVNRQMSTYDKASVISQLNQAGIGQVVFAPNWFVDVWTFNKELVKWSDGQFDPTVGPLVNLWGFGPSGEKKVPSQKQIRQVLGYVGVDKIQYSRGVSAPNSQSPSEHGFSKTHKNVYLDFSATAKGFGVDKVSERLVQLGLPHHLVEVGGELFVRGTKGSHPWRVAIESPTEGGRSLHRVFALQDKCLATSGNYRNYFKDKQGHKYAHTLDPKTGEPTQHKLISASVIAESCLEADGMATLLMAVGPDRAKALAANKNWLVYLIVEAQGGQVVVWASDAFSHLTGVSVPTKTTDSQGGERGE